MVSPEKQETFDAIVAIITATLHIDKDKVKLSSTLQDLGADSLSMVEIILKLEDRFGIEIDDAKAEQLTNVQEVLDYISSLRQQ
jgi:acyl carrier protein